MPLSDVHQGMHCTGYSVIQGTQISSFDVEVEAVIQGNAAKPAPAGPGAGPAILVRVSGPAVDATGAGQGFSGSPIYCPDQQGVRRNIGAVAAGVGQYGNQEVLATPIESILSEHPPASPAGARRDDPLVRTARPLEALTVSGLPPRLASILQTAAARSNRPLYISPAPAPGMSGFPVQQLQPGSAVAAGLSTGDISAAGIGTVAYTDANTVWAFGHPLDAAGERSLLLQDAYVYRVIANPGFGSDASGNTATSYKLAAPGHSLGTLSWDGLDAVVGQVGALPSLIPVHAAAVDPATGAVDRSASQVADESALGWPNGSSAVDLVAPLALAQAEAVVLRGEPSRETQTVCLSITVRERPRPMGFCNRYLTTAHSGASPGSSALSTPGELVPGTDIGRALADLENFNFGPLHITDIGVYASAEAVARQAYLLNALPPRRPVRRGSMARLRLLLRDVNGPSFTRMASVRIPRGMRPGLHLLALAGQPADGGSAAGAADLIAALTGGSPTPSASGPGPLSIDGVASQIAKLHHYDGITAKFAGRGSSSLSAAVHVYRDPSVRISGRTIVPLQVAR